MAARVPAARAILLAYIAALCHLAAGQQVYYFTGAIWVKGHHRGSYAVQAVCPQANPVSCSGISEDNYCCPTNNYCTWADSRVACCPNGGTCSGWAGTYQPTSWYASTTQWRPSSTRWRPQSTYVAPAAYTPVQSTVAPVGYGQYCSTLYAHGPNLPTTAQGACGIILVESPGQTPQPNVAAKNGMEYVQLMFMVGVLQLLGGILFVWR